VSGPAPATEFWADARAAVPGFVLIAEVYWDLEWRLQRLGFDFTYDKRLYDRMLHGPAGDVRDHLRADADFQRHSARFIENHDEMRSATAFGERLRAAAVVMSTLPGLRFFQDGQFGGCRARVPVQLGVRDESTELVEIHSGIAQGDTVLLGSAQGLADGAAVRITEDEESSR